MPDGGLSGMEEMEGHKAAAQRIDTLPDAQKKPVAVRYGTGCILLKIDKVIFLRGRLYLAGWCTAEIRVLKIDNMALKNSSVRRFLRRDVNAALNTTLTVQNDTSFGFALYCSAKQHDTHEFLLQFEHIPSLYTLILHVDVDSAIPLHSMRAELELIFGEDIYSTLLKTIKEFESALQTKPTVCVDFCYKYTVLTSFQ